MNRKPIRVLQVVPNMHQGGLENFIMNMYRNLDRTRVQFDFLEHYAQDYYFDKEIRELGGRIYRIPFMEHKTQILKYVSSLRIFFASHPEYHIVHGHMATTAPIYLKVALESGVKNRIIHAHEDSYLKDPRGIVRMLLIKQAWRYATLRFACSDTSGQYYYGKRSYILCRNAIDAKRFTYNPIRRNNMRKQLGIPDDGLVIGHIGRFAMQKNHVFLVRSFAKALTLEPRAYLVMVGTGERKEEIRALVDTLGIGRHVRMLDPMGNPEDVYCAMDVFALPSFFEGLPLTGIEAQCNGLPCLFSDTVTREVCLTDCCSFLSINNTEDQWATAMVQCVKSRNVERIAYAQSVRDFGYDAHSNAQKMMELYLQLEGEPYHSF